MTFNNSGIHEHHSTAFVLLEYRNVSTENNMSVDLDHYANNENLMRLQTEHVGDDTKTDIQVSLVLYDIIVNNKHRNTWAYLSLDHII